MLSQLEILKRIKDQYDRNSLNVLVGSGFSKNAISSYPNWDELLRDLTVELYADEIDKEYEIQKNVIHGPIISYEEFRNRKAIEYIRSRGYLDIVSDYIKRKGYREAMDVYIEEHLPYIIKSDDNMNLSVRYKGNLSPFDKANLVAHQELLLCRWKNIYTTNYDNVLDITNEINGYSYKVCQHGYDLSSLGPDRGIIKVHGSMVGDSLNGEFEFDNDRNIRYIISKEDYDTYAEKHQPFSFLMRTSLLINSFLLVGFSGNDPNFLGWLGWMKDVLDKSRKDSQDEYKVYLVTLGKPDLSLSRQLFYKNHRICVFDLLDNDVLRTLFKEDDDRKRNSRIGNKEPIVEEKHSIRDIFIHFFKYLRGEARKLEAETDRYRILWSEANANPSLDLISKIRSHRKPLFIPETTSWQEQCVRQSLNNKDSDWSAVGQSLFSIAINDLGYVPMIFGNRLNKNISALQEVPEFKEMQALQNAFQNGTDFQEPKDDISKYSQILYHLYHFEYDSATSLLEEWDAQGDWTILKAACLADFDLDEAEHLLQKYISGSYDSEYKYRASVFANVFSGVFPSPYPYDEFKQNHIRSLWMISDNLLKSLEKQTEDFSPYGVTKHTITFDSYSKSLRSLQYLVFLAKTGFRIGFKYTYLVDAKRWYKVVREAYEVYPFPYLYYSLQVSNKDILTRIGQNYAYSYNLYESGFLPRILSALLTNIYNGTKGFPLLNALVFTKELFVAVREDEWFDMFYKIFSEIYVPQADKVSHAEEMLSFVKRAVGYIAEDDHILKIIDCVIDNIEKDPVQLSDILYDCSHIRTIHDLPKDISDKLGTLVDKIELKDGYLLFIVTAQCGWLSTKYKELIAKKIIDDSEYVYYCSLHVLHSLTYLTNKNEEAIGVIKRTILRRDIWNCGVEERSASAPDYLNLNEISPDIEWTKEEVEAIIANLSSNLAKIENSAWLASSAGEAFNPQCISLLEAMYDFVSLTLPRRLNYEVDKALPVRIKKCIEAIGKTSFSYQKLYNTKDDVSDVLQYLAKLIDANGVAGYSKELSLIFTRILMREPMSLNLELSFLEWLLHKHWEEVKADQGIISQMELILYKYKGIDNYYEELHLDLPFALQNLRYVAEQLDGTIDESSDDRVIVDYWLRDPMVKRFNEVLVYGN